MVVQFLRTLELKLRVDLLKESKGLTDSDIKQLKASTDALSSYVIALSSVEPAASAGVGAVKGLIKALLGRNRKTLILDDARAAAILELSKIHHRLIVFIDDLDRVTPREFAETLLLVKAVADFPNVTYLLAFDRDVAAKFLRETGFSDGNSYLEKIVQLSVPLPPPSFSRLCKYFDSSLKSILPEALEDAMHRSDHRIEERLSTIFHFYGLKKLFKTPRDVQRVLNKVCVIEPSLRGDVNLADLIAFSAIEHKCPSFVAWIEGVRIASGFDAQPIFRDLNDKGSSFQSQFDVFKSSLPTADKEVISRLVTFLFPQLSVVPDSSNNQDLVAGHIGHPKVLNIALRHFTFDGAIRPSVANAFLNATKASEQSAILDEIESWEEMESFLDIVNGETFRLDEAERAAAAIAFAQAFGRVPAPKTFDAELFLPRIVWSGEQERPGLAKNFSDIDAVFDHHLCVDYSTLLLWWNANIVSDEERRFKPFAEGASIVALRRKICVHVQSSILNGTFLGSYKQINRLVWILREEPKLLGDLTKWISQSDDRRNDFLEKSEPEFNASSSTGGPYFHFYQNYWDLIGGYETWKVFAERRLSQKDSNLSNMQRLRFVGIRDAAPP